MILILFLAGSGWAISLLPEDPATRVALAPALGIAAIVLAALAWDRVGLPLTGGDAVGPLAVAAVAGWAAALLHHRQPDTGAT